MLRVRLERVRRHLNEERFHEILVSADLFDAWIMEHRWGRIGGEDDGKSYSFVTRHAACGAARKFCREKLARGYQVAADPDALLPLDLLPPDDAQTRLLRAADALERLLQDLPAHRDSRMGRIAASLATACRLRRCNGERWVPPGQQRAAWLLDDIDSRIRVRVFQLLDELVSGVLTEDDEHAVFRMIQEATSPGAGTAAIRLIPRTKHALLDQKVADVFSADRELAEFGLDAAERGVRFVGELVELNLAEVMRLARGDRAVVRHLEDRLRELGLPLGARAPGWRPPLRPALSA